MNESDVLNFIGKFNKKFHQLPTLEDIAIHIGTAHARELVKKLVEQKYLKRGEIKETQRTKHGKKKA